VKFTDMGDLGLQHLEHTIIQSHNPVDNDDIDFNDDNDANDANDGFITLTAKIL